MKYPPPPQKKYNNIYIYNASFNNLIKKKMVVAVKLWPEGTQRWRGVSYLSLSTANHLPNWT